MRRIVVLTLLSFFASPGPRPVSAQDLTELARRAKHSVVVLKVHDRLGRELGTGSGFFVDPEGLIVTNHHVIEPGHRVEAVLSNQKTVRVSGIVAQDKTNDLAVIKVDSGPYPALSLADSSPVETGQQIVVFGNPLGLAGSLSEGHVSAVRQDAELPNGEQIPGLQISAAISPGSSGSPVMNLEGDVVGVVVSQMRVGQNVNFAVPSEAVRQLLATVDSSAAPRPFTGAQVVREKTGAYLRNLVISAFFFAAVYFGFRRLR